MKSIISRAGKVFFWTVMILTSLPYLEAQTAGFEVGVVIRRYTGGGSVVNIPDRINGVPVTSIEEYAFYGCESLSSITIPASVTFIGERAFFGCTSLAGVTVTGENSRYTSNNGILFDKQMQTLILYPAGKSGSYTIPSSVDSIGEWAFSGCSNLTSVTIPPSVTSIGEYAFSGCSSLTSITIPPSVVSIGEGAFDGCSFNALIVLDLRKRFGEHPFYGK